MVRIGYRFLRDSCVISTDQSPIALHLNVIHIVLVLLEIGVAINHFILYDQVILMHYVTTFDQTIDMQIEIIL